MFKLAKHPSPSSLFSPPPLTFLVTTCCQGDGGRPRFGGSTRIDGQNGVLVGADVLPGGDNGRGLLGPVRAAAEPARGDDTGGWSGTPIEDDAAIDRWDGSSGGVTRLRRVARARASGERRVYRLLFSSNTDRKALRHTRPRRRRRPLGFLST